MIHADLTSQSDITSARSLRENLLISFMQGSAKRSAPLIFQDASAASRWLVRHQMHMGGQTAMY